MTDLALTVKDALATLEAIEKIPCDSPQNAALLNEVFVFAYAEANRLEKELKAKLERVKAVEKARKARAMPAIDALRAVADKVREKTENAALADLERREAGLSAAVTAAKAGEALVLPEERQDLPGGLTVSFAWDFEIVGEVDPEFQGPDSGKIKVFLADYKNSSHVPARAGLRWKRQCLSRAKPVKT